MAMSVISNAPDKSQAKIFLIGVREAALDFIDNFYRLNDVWIDFIKESLDNSLQRR